MNTKDFSVDKWSIRTKDKGMTWKQFFIRVALIVLLVLVTLLIEMEVGYRWSMAHLPVAEAMSNVEACRGYIRGTVHISGDRGEILAYCKNV